MVLILKHFSLPWYQMNLLNEYSKLVDNQMNIIVN